MDLWMNGWIDR